jgi:RNA polymerase sigma-70 factor (ECF subfamily)
MVTSMLRGSTVIGSHTALAEEERPERVSGSDGAADTQLTFAEAYSEHFDFVWRSLRHLGVADQVMDDAVQDMWIVVHRRLGDFEGRSSLSTWLFGIAINVARSARRAKACLPLSELPAELLSEAPDPERVLVGNDAWNQVQSFLDTLPELGRAIFVSALLENFSPAETAEAVGLDVATVYKRVRALRRAFQRRLSQREEIGL